ncbi:hypothetical protein [Roseibium sediminis]|uniref:hypothetical protein n=1 Tax=Roseibium sediminis TaxID=1775174 RepID=UPI00123E2121|nr:hypothetical protein [Roseibium sediminis]
MDIEKPSPKSEATDLERRVLAHERILQSLIAYMARSEPRFVDHLKTRFVDTMSMARREQDYRDVDDYAEEFIRAVMHLGETYLPPKSEILKSDAIFGHPLEGQLHKNKHEQPAKIKLDRVRVRERNGIWEVRVDGVFLGDYHKLEHARTAAAVARLSLQ